MSKAIKARVEILVVATTITLMLFAGAAFNSREVLDRQALQPVAYQSQPVELDCQTDQECVDRYPEIDAGY